MANEISISASLAFDKTITDSFSCQGLTFTMSGTEYIKNVQSIGTSEEALIVGDVTPGFILMKNLDPTNFVSFRSATGATNTVKLKPGEIALFRSSGAAPFMIADTGACRVQYLLIED